MASNGKSMLGSASGENPDPSRGPPIHLRQVRESLTKKKLKRDSFRAGVQSCLAAFLSCDV
jgi:hypothetical protein